jgi:hypothetical protein
MAQRLTSEASTGSHRNCAIKGNISDSGRIYHMPGSQSYAETVNNEADGERWFCSEEESNRDYCGKGDQILLGHVPPAADDQGHDAGFFSGKLEPTRCGQTHARDFADDGGKPFFIEAFLDQGQDVPATGASA